MRGPDLLSDQAAALFDCFRAGPQHRRRSRLPILGAMRTWSWRPQSPTRCPNGHTLGPGQVLVGHQACLGHGGGHTTWTCRECDATVYGPPLNTHVTTLAAATSLQALPLGDPGRTKPIPKAAQTWPSMESGTPNCRVLYRQAGPLCQPARDAIARGECFTSEDDDHEVALSAQKSGMGTSWGHRLFLLR